MVGLCEMEVSGIDQQPGRLHEPDLVGQLLSQQGDGLTDCRDECQRQVTQCAYDAAHDLLTLTGGKRETNVTRWNYDKFGRARMLPATRFSARAIRTSGHSAALAPENNHEPEVG